MHSTRCNCTKGILSLTGDMLLRKGGDAYAAIARESFNASLLFGPLLKEIASADIFFFNQEGAITSKETARDTFYPEHFYIRSDPEVLKLLSTLNKKNTVSSLANNHISDFGREGMLDTKKNLESVGIKTVGMGTEAELEKPLIIEVRGTRISFLAFTDLLHSVYFSEKAEGVFRLTEKNLAKAIHAAKLQSDIVVVSLHTVADFVTPFNEAPDYAQKRFAYAAADAGADLVVGHQPHGLQYVEKHAGAIIFHSLGALLYNPQASLLYPKGHSLHFGTQFYGGSILKIAFCKHGLTIKKWIPTRVTLEAGVLRVIRDSFLQRMKVFSFLLLSGA